MIAIFAPEPLKERFLREILAPLGVPVATGTPETAPSLAVVWVAAGQEGAAAALAASAGQVMAIAAEGAALPFETDALFHLGFRPGAVTNRARTLLARAAMGGLPAVISFGPYDFRPRENTVHDKNTNEIQKLTDKEREMLLILLRAGGKPVSRQDLLDSVWAYAPDAETHTLETHIYRLRQKIEKDPGNPVLLLTDPEGYRILPS